ncbi:MAG TPA: hypothetical protein VI197_24615 [Polyangiaceae bacterium]
MTQIFRVAVVGAWLLSGCGDRDDKWDASPGEARSVGLVGAAAVLDTPLNRVLVVTSPKRHAVRTHSFDVGKNVAVMATSADRDTLFVLSKGVQPRRNPDDELPSVTVIQAGPSPSLEHRFELTDPMQALAVDPQEEWLVAFKGDSTVTNPNEFVLLPLGDPGERQSVTIRSFGGIPEEVVFTDELSVPAGPPRRFLIVRTDRDIALVDLLELESEEVTVQTPSTNQGAKSRPAQVVFDPGSPASDDELGDPARIGVRLEGEPDVMLLELGEPADGSARDFKINFNIVNVGGVPSAIEFVHTDFGLRLAALVPAQSGAKLIDPATTALEAVDFPKPYSKLTRVEADGGAGELALLYSPDVPGIAFWALGRASGALSKSVEQNEIDLSVAAVRDVPGELRHLKILEGNQASRFFVLDLEQRQTFPMLTETQGFTVNVAPDGRRAWAFHHARTEFASVDLSDLHPTSLSVRMPVSAVHDIEREDGSRAALVLHGTDGALSQGTLGLTLFDAKAPDSADTRFFGGLLLEGL